MSKTETQSEALRLAEFFGSMKKSSHRWYDGVPVHEKAAAELRRLDAEVRELKMTVQHESLCVEAAKERIKALDAENKALRERLEIDPAHPIDGIEARDETIRQLEAQIKGLRIKAARYDYLRTGGRYIVKIAQDSIYCGGHSMSEKYGPALDDAIDTAMASQRRQKAADMFDSAAQTLEEATASATAMANAMEQEGRLMKAPMAAAKNGGAA